MTDNNSHRDVSPLLAAHIKQVEFFDQVREQTLASCTTAEEKIDAIVKALPTMESDNATRPLTFDLCLYAAHPKISVEYKLKSLKAVTDAAVMLTDTREIGTLYSNLTCALTRTNCDFKSDWNTFLQKTISDFSLHDLMADDDSKWKSVNHDRLVAIEEFGTNNILSPETIECTEKKLQEFGLEKISLAEPNPWPAEARYGRNTNEKDVQRVLSLILNQA